MVHRLSADERLAMGPKQVEQAHVDVCQTTAATQLLQVPDLQRTCAGGCPPGILARTCA